MVSSASSVRLWRQPPGRWALLVLAAATMLGGPLVYFGGYVSPDSSNYLQLAQHIADAGRFDHIGPWGDGHPRTMTTWPLAFPCVIAAFTFLGMDAWSASKLLSWVLLATNIGLVVRIFGVRTRALTLAVFLLPSCLRIHVYSWSEQLFIAALLCTLAAAQRLRDDHRWWPALAGAMTLAFTTRYIGAFAPLTVLAGALVLTRLPNRKWFIVAAALTLTLDGGYLLNNLRVGGFLTGGSRIAAPEGLGLLSFAFVRSVVIDAAPYIPLLGFGALALRRTGGSRWRTVLREHPDAAGFVALGIAYLAALFVLRNIRHFDMFNPRLTFVGSGLVLIGLAQVIAPPRWLARVVAGFVVLYAVAWTSGHFKKLDLSTPIPRRLERIAEGYRSVPVGSILIAPNRKFGYLEYPQRLVRPDLILVEPNAAPYHTPDTPAAFRARLRSFIANHPDAACFVDDTGIDDLQAHRERIIDRGLRQDTAEALLGNAVPGTFRLVPGCQLLPEGAAAREERRAQPEAPDTRRASITGD